MYNAFITAALTAAVSTVVGSAVSAVIASLIAKKKSKKAIDEVTTARYIAIENGLQSILRAEIIRQHESILSVAIARCMPRKPWSRSMTHTMPLVVTV